MVYPRERIVGILAGLEDLPTISAVVAEVNRIVADPESSAADLGDIISRDQSLTARLLRLANSAIFARRGGVSKITDAIVALGFTRVRSAVLACAVRDALDVQADPPLVQAIWRHALVTACTARRISEVTGLRDPEEVFVAGLLHDVGRLAFLMICPEPYRGCLGSVTPSRSLYDVEKETLGITHAELGSRLLMRWNLPLSITIAAAGHHQPERGHEHSLLMSLVSVSNEAANRAGVFAGDPYPRELPWNRLSELLPLRESDLDRVIGTAKEELGSAEAFLGSLAAPA
jgi:putative nucleotidyltransferase with HDIG domain